MWVTWSWWRRQSMAGCASRSVSRGIMGMLVVAVTYWRMQTPCAPAYGNVRFLFQIHCLTRLSPALRISNRTSKQSTIVSKVGTVHFYDIPDGPAICYIILCQSFEILHSSQMYYSISVIMPDVLWHFSDFARCLGDNARCIGILVITPDILIF